MRVKCNAIRVPAPTPARECTRDLFIPGGRASLQRNLSHVIGMMCRRAGIGGPVTSKGPGLDVHNIRCRPDTAPTRPSETRQPANILIRWYIRNYRRHCLI